MSIITEEGLKDILISICRRLTDFSVTDLLAAGMLLGQDLNNVDLIVQKIQDAKDLSTNIKFDGDREVIMHTRYTLKEFINDEDQFSQDIIKNELDHCQDFVKLEDHDFNHSLQDLYINNAVSVKDEELNFTSSQLSNYEEELTPKMEIISEKSFNSFGKRNIFEPNNFVEKDNQEDEFNDFLFTIQGNSPSFGELKCKEDLEQIELAIKQRSKKRKNKDKTKDKKKKPKPKVQDCLSKTCCFICSEDNRPEDLMSNLGCSHIYHKDCLKNNIIEKIDSLIFPFRCPATPCRTNMPRDIIVPLLNDKQVRMYDDLHLVNRVEKGKRVLLWCCNCIGLYSVFKKDSQACPRCDDIGINIRKVLNYKYQEELSDDEYSKLKDQIDLDKYCSKKQRRDFLELEKVLKTKVKRCLKCFDWNQNISGLENFKCIPSKCKGVKKSKNKKAVN